MRKARAFFYVAAGIFLFALSYHLGARSAGAQAGGEVEAAMIESSWQCTATVGRQLYYMNTLDQTPVLLAAPPVPGTSRIVTCKSNGSDGMAVLGNGEVWAYSPPSYGASWHLSAIIPTGPTPAHLETWGALKSRYRETPGAVQPTQDKQK